MYADPTTIIYDPVDPIQCSADIYTPTSTAEGPRDLLVFIHGGAWRTGDKSDHHDLPTLLSTQTTHLPTIIIPNYRLSPHPEHPTRAAVAHPTHITDVARCVRYLVERWAGWTGTRNVVLVGHSCGAHILSHIAFGLPTLTGDETDASSLRASLGQLMRKPTSLAFLDGIYSLNTLIDEYPGYRFFVDAAFGTDAESWVGADVCVPSGAGGRDVPRELRRVGKIVVAHATEDELLSPAQGRLWVEYLRTVGLGGVVEWDDKTLRGTHDGCLHDDGLGKLLYKLLE